MSSNKSQENAGKDEWNIFNGFNYILTRINDIFDISIIINIISIPYIAMITKFGVYINEKIQYRIFGNSIIKSWLNDEYKEWCWYEYTEYLSITYCYRISIGFLSFTCISWFRDLVI